MNTTLWAWVWVLSVLPLGVYAGIAVWRMSGAPLGRQGGGDCDPEPVADDPNVYGLDYEEVQISTPLGVAPAWFVLGDSAMHEGAWAVIVHGRGGTRSSVIDRVHGLIEAGVNCLLISYRGDGVAPDSPDGLDHLGATEWRDLEAAMKFALRNGASQLLLYGFSAGAAVVGQTLKRSPFARKVRMLILEDPALDWESIFLAHKPSWMPGWFASFVLRVAEWRIGHRLWEFNLVDFPPVFRPDTIVLHGTDDEVVPYRLSERFFRSLRPSWPGLSLVTVRGGMHGESRGHDTAELDGRISSWVWQRVRREVAS